MKTSGWTETASAIATPAERFSRADATSPKTRDAPRHRSDAHLRSPDYAAKWLPAIMAAGRMTATTNSGVNTNAPMFAPLQNA